MSDQPTCPDCGAPIPDDAPAGGLCPRCLMKAGLPDQAPTRTAHGGPRFQAPSPEKLAARFPDLEILELVGQGGMGAVYRARQRRLDRVVALKLLTNEAARGPAFAERFTREARTLARVSHPNIVAIYDFGEVAGLYYFLMEYVDGANLREVLRSGKLAPREALAIVPQLCDALEFAHEEGVVHRDIKPENILLDRKGRVKIADFGLAKLLLREQVAYTLTAPGDVMGTPAYMAPEQIERPTEVDHRADIYSLGVVLYEMLTGELPLGRFQPPSSKVLVDVRLDEVVLRTLEKEPERRYQHAVDVKTDVQSLGDGSPARRPSPGSEASGGSSGPAGPAGRVDDARGGGEAVGVSHAARRGAARLRQAGIVTPLPGTGSGATTPGPAPPPRRTIEIRRPIAVTLVAFYSFFMALSYVAFAGLVGVLGRIVPGRVGALFGPWNTGWWGSGLADGVLLGQSHLMSSLLGLGFILLHIFAGAALLRLRSWARKCILALAVLALVTQPVSLIFSALVIVYLVRRDVARLFALGEGPAVVSEEEASRLIRTMGSAARP